MFFRPTYPNFFAFEAGNRTIIFSFWPKVDNPDIYHIYQPQPQQRKRLQYTQQFFSVMMTVSFY
jgi:hypothetical protein